MQEERRTAAEQLDYGRDNLHEQPLDFYRQKFAQMDPHEAAERLRLAFDEDSRSFSLRFLGEDYRISHPDFEVFCEGEGYHALMADDGAKILILRYLTRSVAAEHDGSFMAFREFPSGDLYIKPFQGRCITRFNFKFGKDPDRFRAIMELLGASRVDYADVCYDVELLEGFWVRFILWQGDEEFAPSSQILFSSSFARAFEAYDLAEIGGICLNAFGASAARLEERGAVHGNR